MLRARKAKAKGKRYLTTGEVARALEISPTTARRLAEGGFFPGAIRIGAWWRIPADEVARVMHAMEVGDDPSRNER